VFSVLLHQHSVEIAKGIQSCFFRSDILVIRLVIALKYSPKQYSRNILLLIRDSDHFTTSSEHFTTYSRLGTFYYFSGTFYYLSETRNILLLIRDSERFTTYPRLGTFYYFSENVIGYTSAGVDRKIPYISNFTTGLLNLPNRFLRLCCEPLTIPLSLHFNFIISTAQYPSAWKLATVVPIHKKGSYSDVANYRLIAILPSLSKIFERIIHRHIYSYLENVIQVSVKRFHSHITLRNHT